MLLVYVLLVVWGVFVFVDRVTCGPAVSRCGPVEALMKDEAFRLNYFDDEIMTTHHKVSTNVSFVSRFNPIVSWIPGVSEYRIKMKNDPERLRIRTGSKLHNMVKTYHEDLKSDT